MKLRVGAAAIAVLIWWTLSPATGAEKKLSDYIALRAIGGISSVGDISENQAGPLTENNTDDLVGGLGIALGYDWLAKGLPFRSEISYHHRFRFDFDTRINGGVGIGGDGYENNLSSHVVLVNFFYDINLGPDWRPFIGFGVGWVRNVSDVVRTPLVASPREERTDTNDDLAWAANLGVVYRLTDTWRFELAYRYIDLGTVEMGPFRNGTVIEAEDYYSHDIIIGTQIRF
jgi:opacity protein-like surface antigen